MRYSRLGYWGVQALAAAVMVSAAATVLWVLPPQMIALRLSLITAAMIVASALALSCYRNADEVILQTHKTSWFWGGLAGMIASGVLAIAVLSNAIPIPHTMPFVHRRPEDFYVEGILAALFLQCAGFGVVWAYLNLKRRG